MPTYSRKILSGSTSGRPIPVAAVATPGTTIHTAVAGATSYDEIWIWAANITTTPAALTIEWGGVTDPGDHMCKTVILPANCLPVQIAAGQVLNGGLVVKAFGGAASAINITGFVNQITG